MQVGDLVRIKGEWAQKNPWMRGTLIDDSPEVMGIVVSVRHGIGFDMWKVEWLDGRSSEVLGNKLEVA
tara:strand:+ start:916 stop:1119 length:204 start_codon:yes stop_codon:yes gene_type:complete